MSDTDKDISEIPRGEEPEARPRRGAEVISIEQARAELLGKRKTRATPPRGVDGPPKPRVREVPAPVTMPPGQHSAVIVTDTPAARAHIDKKTVHPGEMPAQMPDKKVRLKTSLDPRRQKTQLTDRRADTEGGREALPPGEGMDALGMWNTPSQPPLRPSSIPPRPGSIPPRMSLARGRPIPREKQGGMLFMGGVILAAGLGAMVVYLLSQGGALHPSGAASSADAVGTGAPATSAAGANGANWANGANGATSAEPVGSGAQATKSAEPSTGEPTTVATASGEPSASGSTVAPVTASSGAKTAPSQVVKPPPTTSPAGSSSATAKPTATSILPFGKEDN
ncbi:MAG: hypothetical protein R3B70_34345 [Polyangiaceae bacterium]